MECANNGLQHWLRCRTVGLAMVYNRLLEFRVVRSTRAVVWQPGKMVEEQPTHRTPEHLARHGDNYPDPCCYLTHQAKYLFRSAYLRHIRIEQFNRYLHVKSDERSNDTLQEIDDVLEGDLRVIDNNHRNHDHYLENVVPGTLFPSVFVGCPSAKRRHDARLGVNRLPCLEPIGTYLHTRTCMSCTHTCPHYVAYAYVHA